MHTLQNRRSSGICDRSGWVYRHGWHLYVTRWRLSRLLYQALAWCAVWAYVLIGTCLFIDRLLPRSKEPSLFTCQHHTVVLSVLAGDGGSHVFRTEPGQMHWADHWNTTWLLSQTSLIPNVGIRLHTAWIGCTKHLRRCSAGHQQRCSVWVCVCHVCCARCPVSQWSTSSCIESMRW